VPIKIAVICDVMFCSLVSLYWRTRGCCCIIHHHGRQILPDRTASHHRRHLSSALWL